MFRLGVWSVCCLRVVGLVEYEDLDPLLHSLPHGRSIPRALARSERMRRKLLGNGAYLGGRDTGSVGSAMTNGWFVCIPQTGVMMSTLAFL